jgi:hypothetical protein
MLTLDQLKDLALLQTHRMTQLEIALARSQNVCEQLATQNNELRGMLPKDEPERTFPTGTDMRTPEEISDHIKGENAGQTVPADAPLVATPEGDQGPAEEREERKRYGHLKGAHWDKQNKHWSSHIVVNGRLVYLGKFDNEVLANAAWVKAEQRRQAGLPIMAEPEPQADLALAP